MPKLYATKFDGYYVTENGEIWTHWHEGMGEKTIPRKLKQHERGGTKENDRYLAVNISIKNKNYKTIQQIKYYSHRLIAETLIPNPNSYSEIDHIDNNKKNNSISNLRWTTRKNNMVRHSARKYHLKDIHNHQIYEVYNMREWVRNNWDWISLRTKSKNPFTFCRLLMCKKKMPEVGFEIERI